MLDEKFSWYTIEEIDGQYILYFHNKKGIERPEFRSRDLDVVKGVLKRREEFKSKIQDALKDALHKLTTDPEALARLQKLHEKED